MKYEIWIKGEEIAINYHSHQVIKRFNNEEDYKKALEGKRIFRTGEEFLLKYTIIYGDEE